LPQPRSESTRRYARLADNALLEVLRTPTKPASDKPSRDEAQQIQRLRRGPSWIRTRDLTGYEPAALTAELRARNRTTDGSCSEFGAELTPDAAAITGNPPRSSRARDRAEIRGLVRVSGGLHPRRIRRRRDRAAVGAAARWPRAASRARGDRRRAARGGSAAARAAEPLRRAA